MKKRNESITKEVDLILFSCKSFENEGLHAKVTQWPEAGRIKMSPSLSFQKTWLSFITGYPTVIMKYIGPRAVALSSPTAKESAPTLGQVWKQQPTTELAVKLLQLV